MASSVSMNMKTHKKQQTLYSISILKIQQPPGDSKGSYLLLDTAGWIKQIAKFLKFLCNYRLTVVNVATKTPSDGIISLLQSPNPEKILDQIFQFAFAEFIQNKQLCFFCVTRQLRAK